MIILVSLLGFLKIPFVFRLIMMWSNHNRSPCVWVVLIEMISLISPPLSTSCSLALSHKTGRWLDGRGCHITHLSAYIWWNSPDEQVLAVSITSSLVCISLLHHKFTACHPLYYYTIPKWHLYASTWLLGDTKYIKNKTVITEAVWTLKSCDTVPLVKRHCFL